MTQDQNPLEMAGASQPAPSQSEVDFDKAREVFPVTFDNDYYLDFRAPTVPADGPDAVEMVDDPKASSALASATEESLPTGLEDVFNESPESHVPLEVTTETDAAKDSTPARPSENG